MKNIKFILLFSLIALRLEGNNVDSLYTLINNSNNRDSAYVRLLNNYLDEKIKTDPSDVNLVLVEEGIQLSRQLNLYRDEVNSLNFLGWYYHYKSKFKEAIIQYQQAIDILDKNNSAYLLFEISSNLANAYAESHDLEKALKMNLRTIEIIKNNPSTPGKGKVYFYTAKTYEMLNDYKNAEIFFLKARKVSEEINFTMGIAIANSSLADIYNKQKFFDKALPLILESKLFYENSDQKVNLAGTYSSLGNVYRGLKKYKKAINNYEKSIKIYHDIGNITPLEQNYSWLAASYKKVGKYEQAIEHYKLALIYADSLFDQERIKAIEDVKTQYETDKFKQQKELAEANEFLANEQAKVNKTVSLAVGFFSLLTLGLLGFIYNKLKIIRSQKVKLDDAYAQLEESKKNELAVSNLKALQSQMNPHFIFNALNSVQDLVLFEDIRSSNKYLGKFSDLIRKILLSSKKQFIPLEEELEILGLYLDLEKLRFGEEFHVDLSCDISEEEQETIQLPAMFIQPYVENAIKHGLFNKKGDKRLKVAFSLINNKTLECIIEDNGIGQEQAAILKKERLHLHTGFSTEAINERIRLLNQTQNKKIELQQIDLAENGQVLGTKIILHFPI